MANCFEDDPTSPKPTSRIEEDSRLPPRSGSRGWQFVKKGVTEAQNANRRPGVPDRGGCTMKIFSDRALGVAAMLGALESTRRTTSGLEPTQALTFWPNSKATPGARPRWQAMKNGHSGWQITRSNAHNCHTDTPHAKLRRTQRLLPLMRRPYQSKAHQ
jgi:hypothetical protein